MTPAERENRARAACHSTAVSVRLADLGSSCRFQKNGFGRTRQQRMSHTFSLTRAPSDQRLSIYQASPGRPYPL